MTKSVCFPKAKPGIPKIILLNIMRAYLFWWLLMLVSGNAPFTVKYGPVILIIIIGLRYIVK